jgi:hypothetical protein
MKPCVQLLLVFCCSSLAWAGSPDYNVNIHVTASYMLRDHGDGARRQQLDVVIDGRKLQLESETIPNALLSLGDYKAKLVKNDHWRGAPYDSYEVYEMLLPDKHTRRFIVVGQSE